MNSPQNSSDSGFEPSKTKQDDIERLRNLWKDVKETKRALQISQSDQVSKTNKQERGQRLMAQSLLDDERSQQSNISDLHEDNNRTRELEKKLQKTRELNKILNNKLIEAEDEIETTTAQQMEMYREQSQQLKEIQSRLEKLQSNNNLIIDKAQAQSDIAQDEIQHRENEIKRLNSMLTESIEKYNRLIKEHRNLLEAINDLERNFDGEKIENTRIKQRLEETEKTLDEMYLAKKSEGIILMENEQMKQDLARLLNLLKCTEEFRHFTDYTEDSKGVSFLKDLKRYSKYDLPVSRQTRFKCYRNQQGEEQLVDEQLLWVPQDATKFMNNFKKDFRGELTDEIIQRILFELNKIWSQREFQQIQRIKLTHKNEINTLKRKIEGLQRFDEVQAKRTISRLRQQIKVSQKENKDVSMEKSKRSIKSGDYILDTVKFSFDFEKERRRLEFENQKLKKRVSELEDLSKTPNYERYSFIEGAQWMLEKVSKEVNKFKRSFLELVDEYQDKANNILEREDDYYKPEFITLMRRQDWLMESVDNQLIVLNERIINLSDTTQLKLDECRAKFKGILNENKQHRDQNQTLINEESTLDLKPISVKPKEKTKFKTPL